MEGTGRYKQVSAPPIVVPGAQTPNGEPLAVGAVLDALNAEAGGGPRMVPGPWRGTVMREDERVHLVRRNLTDWAGDSTVRSHAVVFVREDQVEAVDRHQAETRLAVERSQQRATAQAIAAGTGDGTDPLADLREDA